MNKLLKSKTANAQTIFNLLGILILDGISYLTITIFSRVLGTEGYGVVSLYTTWVQIFTILCGMQVSASIGTAVVHFDEEDKDGYISSALSLSLISCIFISIVFLVFHRFIAEFMGFKPIVLIFVLMQSFGTYIVTCTTTKFIYKKEAQKNFFLSVSVCLITNILAIILVFLWPDKETNYLARIIGFAIPYFVFGLILLLIALNRGKVFYNKRYWKYCLVLCLPLIFHALSQIILGQSDKIMIQKIMDSNSAVGIYSLIVTFVHVLNVLYSAFNSSFVPFFYDDLKSRKLVELKKKSNNYLSLFVLIVIGFLLVSKEVIMLFSSADYWSGLRLIPVCVLSSLFVFLYSFPVNLEFYYKKTVSVAVGTCLSSAINIILNFFLIRLYGIWGAAIATALAYFALLVFHHIIAIIIDKDKLFVYNIVFYLKAIVPVLLVSILFYVTYDLWYIRCILAVIDGLWILYSIYKRKSIF